MADPLSRQPSPAPAATAAGRAAALHPATPPAGATRSAEAATADETFIRRAGKVLVMSIHGALRAMKLYPLENTAVQKAIADVTTSADDLFGRDNALTVRTSGEVVFVNDIRLRLELDCYAAFTNVLGVLRTNGIGRLHVHERATARDWLTLLGLLQRPPLEDLDDWRTELTTRLEAASIGCFELGQPNEDEGDESEEARSASKRVYARSVAVAKEVLQSTRVGRPPSLRRLKRAVQGIVDQILSDETPLLGLTTLRDYDEYTFTHSVNVAIFAVAIGKRLGLGKVQLYDLGLSAVLHDIGKTRLPVELINKTSGLTADDWRQITEHPWRGVLTMFMLPGSQELPLRAMKVAYEHHRKVDGSGYPRAIRPRDMGLFSRIVAVADGFDAATSRRSYQETPFAPTDVLREMRENPARGLDPIVVKALVNTLGVYPVGTLIVLDTFELALVHAAVPEALSRPIVRVISDPLGNVLYPGHLLDLSARDANGEYARSIINTAEPERYGIRVSDYFI